MGKLTLRQKICLFLALVPPLFLGGFLALKAVNVPFYDQWELVPIIQHVKEGHVVFNDFWHQHNEHRLLFPRLVMIGAAVLTKWNTKIEAFIGFTIALVSFALLMKTLDSTLKKLKKQQGLSMGLIAVLSLVWFSLVQWENWLWGWQIQWFLSVFGVICVLYALSTINKKDIPNSSLALLLLGGFVAQFSLGNGVLIWPPLIIAMLYLGLKRSRILASTGFALVTTGLYYYHYVNPTNNPPKSYALHHPLAFLKYFFVYLGRSTSYFHYIGPILGVILLGVFLGVCTLLYLEDNDRFRTMMPIVLLGVYSLASAFVTDISRLGLGIGQASTSRYTTISSLLLVSTIILCFYSRDLIRKRLKVSTPLYKYGSFASVVILLGLLVSNAWWATNGANVQSQYLKDIRSCTHAEVPYDVCLLSTYPDKATVTPRLYYLKQIHWGGY